jgi:hypothetical protein
MSSFTNRQRLVLTGLILCLAGALVAYACRRYLHNVLFGPFSIDGASLLSLKDPDEGLEYFVTVAGDETALLFPRAYTGGQEPYSMYGLLRVGSKWLLVRVPSGKERLQITGTLERLSEFERDHVLGARTKGTAGRKAFLPLRLDACRYFRTVGWLLAVLPIAGLVLVGGTLMVFGIRSRKGTTCSNSEPMGRAWEASTGPACAVNLRS